MGKLSQDDWWQILADVFGIMVCLAVAYFIVIIAGVISGAI
jgi:hypothetical protein